MNAKSENLKRALALMTLEADGAEYQCYGNVISVRGHTLHLLDNDDFEVLSILAAEKELGFAIGYFEQAAITLRAMQREWVDAAAAMKAEAAS